MGQLNNKEPWQVILEADSGYDQQSVGGTAAGLSIPTGATGATINVEAAAADLGGGRILRYRLDGGDPTSSVGNVVGDGAQINLINQSQLQAFKAISATANTQILNVQFYYNTLST